MTSALEESKESVSNILFLITEHYRICRGRMERLMGLATQLIGFFSFTWFIAPQCGKGFLSFFLSPLGFLCMKRKTFKWQTQTPGALQRLKASQDCCCCCSCHHPFHWHDGMKGCMSPLPSPPISFPCAPLVIQPLPSFIFVVWIIFEPFILFVCRVFKKKQHSAMSKSFQGVWEAREKGWTSRKVL